jgi:arylsulfatase A-like enzyme
MRWPGHIQPGRSSNEIFCILDFYRTLAHIAGAAEKVPTDRPMDSVDQADFILGKQEKSNREAVMYFHSGDLLAIKWRNFKAHLKVRLPAEGAVRQAGRVSSLGLASRSTIRGFSILKTIQRSCGTSTPPAAG